jgi:predicted nucleotidyltransferase
VRSSILRWPDAALVEASVGVWANREVAAHPEIRRVGYFGSYARGDWGVGSDLDLIVIVDRAEEPFERRALSWDTTDLPVPAELLVYTTEEWDRLGARGSRFHATVMREARWAVTR